MNRHPTLTLDTKHFHTAFIDRLLASFPDLDEITDGVIIHGENFQALNLLREKYRAQITCAYIDPPYNTGGDDFLYKDNYQFSSWLAMLESRLALAQALVCANGAFLCSIDDTSIDLLRSLFQKIYGRGGFMANFVWRRRVTSSLAQSWVSTDHEYVLAFSPNPSLVEVAGLARDKSKYNIPDGKGGFYASMPLTVGMNRSQRPNQWYELVNPRTGKGYWPPPNRVWGFYPPTMQEKIAQDRIIWPDDYPDRKMKVPRYKAYQEDAKRDRKPVSTWIAEKRNNSDETEGEADSFVLQSGKTEEGTRWLKTLFGEVGPLYPKPVSLLYGLLQQFCTDKGVVLDFFAGSGTTAHAIINLNRDDEGQRKFILVEMADYFDTVLLPRLKKITFTPEWKDGKPERMATREEADRSPRILKYIRLENYEDALNNIEFDDASGQRAIKFDDYLLKYMLRWETRSSATLLNVPQLSSPFGYSLNIYREGQTRPFQVDLAETFNYLLGLHVTKRVVLHDDKRRYLVYRGRIDHRETVVIWRDTQGWSKEDFERERKFVAESKITEGAEEVFVNGDSFISNAKALDPVFKARMLSQPEA